MELRPIILQLPKYLSLTLILLSVASCGRVITNAKIEFSQDLAETILESDDPETIKKGVPAYLILISSMIKGDPENPALCRISARRHCQLLDPLGRRRVGGDRTAAGRSHPRADRARRGRRTQPSRRARGDGGRIRRVDDQPPAALLPAHRPASHGGRGSHPGTGHRRLFLRTVLDFLHHRRAAGGVLPDVVWCDPAGPISITGGDGC